MAEINDVVEQASESGADYQVGYRRPPKKRPIQARPVRQSARAQKGEWQYLERSS
jgi:hypothetical protein